MDVEPLSPRERGEARDSDASSRPLGGNSNAPYQMLAAAASIAVSFVGGLFGVLAYIEGHFKADLAELKADLKDDRKRFKDDLAELKADLKDDHKRFKDDLKDDHKRFKDELRLQAQATMNPPRAHLMFSDQRQIDDVLRDPENAPLAHTRRWWRI
jgi:hypothetical protein